jgi:uncharacterized protein with FMN-binding domain
MKKLFLSTTLIIVFAGYTAYFRMTGISAVSPLPLNGQNPSSAPLPAVTSSEPIPPPALPTPVQDPSPVLPASSSEPVPPPPTPVPFVPASSAAPQGMYKDGVYTGVSADAYYGNVQVKVTIQNGKIADVQFLDYPRDRSTSLRISNTAMPLLRSEAIQAQSAPVDMVSGATEISGAFNQSFASALVSARN